MMGMCSRVAFLSIKKWSLRHFLLPRSSNKDLIRKMFGEANSVSPSSGCLGGKVLQFLSEIGRSLVEECDCGIFSCPAALSSKGVEV